MADIKIFNMVEATTITDTDLIVVEDSADTKKITKANFKETMGINNVYTKAEVDGLTTSGSNANGRWTKFSDGTLICVRTVSINFNTVNEQSWDFPSAFIYIPSGSISYGVSVIGGVGFSNKRELAKTPIVTTLASWKIRFGDVYASTDEAYLLATGRWKA